MSVTKVSCQRQEAPRQYVSWPEAGVTSHYYAQAGLKSVYFDCLWLVCLKV